MVRFRVKLELFFRVRSRSLIVGTRGFCSGAIELPSTDNALPSDTIAELSNDIFLLEILL